MIGRIMFSFISRLREFPGSGEEPAPEFIDPILGAMRWNEDEEAWIGEYNGFHFALPYDRKREPALAIIEYAREMLTNSQWLNDGLSQSKALALRDFGPYYLDEVNSLVFGLIHFYSYKQRPRIFAELVGEREYRCWRIEYSGTNCEGLGFDN